ncbi:hypothetical protein APHAL10511_001416 [Amanita phalloides]|nr:hypothetical protein APHAL10511_001416 [Amanita phalloides]
MFATVHVLGAVTSRSKQSHVHSLIGTLIKSQKDRLRPCIRLSLSHSPTYISTFVAHAQTLFSVTPIFNKLPMMQSDAEAMVALMGATGTGKSTFINLLTGDDKIYIGHDLESKTFDVDTSIYIDEEVGVCVTLLDTPGFDDSRKGVSDTDILGKIAHFLQDGGGHKLNGILYLHRISDPRFSGTAKKSLRIFRELCGDDKLDHVRFVTTYWNVVSEKEGTDREAALADGVFKPFLDAGAKLIRHDGGSESAKKIISDLSRQTPVSMKIQEQLNAGMALGDTSAGAVIIEEMKELQKKHENEMEELKKELEEAANETDEDLKAELDEERRKLEERIAQVEEDRRRLATMRLNLDERSQQDVGDIGRVGPAKHEEETRQPLQKDRGQGGEQRDSNRKGEQGGGGNRTTAEVTLAGGERREQTRQDVPRPPGPPVQSLSQVIHATPEKINEKAKARAQKDKILDVEQLKSYHEDERGEAWAPAEGALTRVELHQRKAQTSYPSRRPPDREPDNTLKDTAALSARQQDLERAIAARDKEVADLQAMLKISEEDNQKLRRRREAKRAALSVYRQNVESTIAARDKEVADLRAALKRSEESNGTVRRQWEGERAALYGDRENMERTIVARGKEVANLQAVLKRSEESNRTLRRPWEEERAQLKREVTRLEAEIVRLNQDRNARLGENRSWAMKPAEKPPVHPSTSKGYFFRR